MSGTASPQIDTLTIYNGDLIAGGIFTTIGGQRANAIARWNGVVWQPLGSGIGDDPGDIPQVSALTVFDNQLIVGGGFTMAGGQPAINVARWRDCHICEADINEDNQVNIDDLLAVINGWGPCAPAQPPPPCPADFYPPGATYPDGVVDWHELFWMVNHWGPCPAPPNACDSDITQNGTVNADDLLAMIDAWGPCPAAPPQPLCPSDITHNGAVTIDDLLMVINGWGPCP